MIHTHIVYYTTHKDKIIYLGSGLPNRYKHTTSGTSHVYDLNRLHFSEERENREKAYQRLNQHGKKLPQHSKHKAARCRGWSS